MKRELFDNNPLLKLSFQFSVELVRYCEELESKRRFVLASQLLRSGTSIGANAMEAQNAESKADFIHKIKIAAKEAEETQYWLWICEASENYPDCSHLISKTEELNKILGSIIHSARRNHLKNKQD